MKEVFRLICFDLIGSHVVHQVKHVAQFVDTARGDFLCFTRYATQLDYVAYYVATTRFGLNMKYLPHRYCTGTIVSVVRVDCTVLDCGTVLPSTVQYDTIRYGYCTGRLCTGTVFSFTCHSYRTGIMYDRVLYVIRTVVRYSTVIYWYYWYPVLYRYPVRYLRRVHGSECRVVFSFSLAFLSEQGNANSQ